MPIYEYVCQACTHRFEVRQKFSDPPVDTCERCGKTVQRVISPPAIMFKGTGWYVTDYSDKLKAPTDSAASTSGGSSGNGTAGSETKKESATPAASSPAPTSATSSAPASPSTSTSSS